MFNLRVLWLCIGLLLRAKAYKCFQGNYPILLGGAKGFTYIGVMDIAPSGDIVLGGDID